MSDGILISMIMQNESAERAFIAEQRDYFTERMTATGENNGKTQDKRRLGRARR